MACDHLARRLAGALAGVLLFACGGGTTESAITTNADARPGAPPTVDRLEGVWLDTQKYYVVFKDDGQFAADDERGHLYFTPYMAGSYVIENNTITFTTKETEICTKGDTSAWTASLPEPGKLDVEVIDGGSQPCGWSLGDHELLRLGDS